MRCIAHRGFAGLYPENTLAAIEQAGQRAAMIELDVRRCGSGELVVHHDETVDRLTTANGRVADMTATELSRLNIEGSGEGVPSLAEAIEAVPADVGLDLELKESGLLTDVRDRIADVDRDIWLSSFDISIVEAASEQTDCPVVLLVGDSSEAGIERAAGLGCAGLAPHWRLVDFALIERAHRADLGVYPWTITDVERAETFAKMGIDGIIADDPVACIEE
ncbi:glycerophosphodiester phosphodiesterase [Halorhabdus sp. CBA1104]|uniref:glycerophosphodiester phosphodiesterase n=1 Tax=Halorhabdus sp. CBA1104 TaxID=1380432 RepID=UPI0012B368F2|nr:glycerophosphodiester phosphodiesterase [Halorhabdus sp. CBA1104]QGN06556.1 glycerophosphodiester phosphodiesterase [Halorhabdus sp. CBA1104]